MANTEIKVGDIFRRKYSNFSSEYALFRVTKVTPCYIFIKEYEGGDNDEFRIKKTEFWYEAATADDIAKADAEIAAKKLRLSLIRECYKQFDRLRSAVVVSSCRGLTTEQIKEINEFIKKICC